MREKCSKFGLKLDAAALNNGTSEIDLILGGISFRGQSFNPNDTKYGSPYLSAIYAGELMSLIGVPSEQDFGEQLQAERAASATQVVMTPDGPAPAPNATPLPPLTEREIHDAYVKAITKDQKAINSQLNQLFVLKSIAAILDSDAEMLKQSLTVPMERLNYAVRKILVVDGPRLNEGLFEGYIQSLLIDAYNRGGEEALKTVGEIGITDEIVAFYRGTLPAGSKPAEIYAAFKTRFTNDMLAVLRNGGQPTGAKLPAYKDVPAALKAYFNDVLVGSATTPVASAEERAAYDAERFSWIVKMVAREYAGQTATLAALGLTRDIADYYRGAAVFSKAAMPDLEAFKSAFTKKMTEFVATKGQSALGRLDFHGLPDDTVAYFSGKLKVDADWILYERLKAKVGGGSYDFQVRWTPGTSDGLLSTYAEAFKEAWPVAKISGQGPRGGAERLPESLDAFRQAVGKKLLSVHKYILRQKVANTWLRKFWRNRDLFNPWMPQNATHDSQIFNPLNQISFIDQAESKKIYDEEKDNLATQFQVTEIKLGNITGKPAPLPENDERDAPVPAVDPRLAQCTQVFKASFERPYAQKQGDIVNAIFKDLDGRRVSRDEIRKAMTGAGLYYPELFSETLFAPSYGLPAAAFAEAYKAAREFKAPDGSQPCADFVATVKTHTVSPNDRFKKDATEAERVRLRFLSDIKGDPRQLQSFIPYVNRIDSQGNVHHYFFHRVPRAKMSYLTLDNRDVDYAVRDIITGRRLSERMAEVVGDAIGRHYSIHARVEPFSWNGVPGFQLLPSKDDPRTAVVTMPSKWIPQLFGIAQKHGETSIPTSQLFEAAYGI